jgi:tRNA nucleotidyltransferase/poly(A) polymerase
VVNDLAALMRSEPWSSGHAVAAVLLQAGHETYAAGGCVRDLLLGRSVHDIDLATAAHPEEVESLFESHGWRTTAVGKAFGVVIVVAPSGANIEVATFRHDGAYIDGRRPTTVTYSSARDDVERRDFTVNALLFDVVRGVVIDHVGGRADLERRLVRAVGDPVARLREDRLRVLRGLRFAARLEFTIEAATWTALCATPLAGLSGERLVQELDKALSGPGAGRWLRLLHASGHLGELCAPLAALAPEAVEHLATRLECLQSDDHPAVRLALWLSPLAVASARAWLRQQPLAAALARTVGWLLEHAREPERWADLSLAARRRLWRHADGRLLGDLLERRFADQPTQGEAVRTLVAELAGDLATPWTPLLGAEDLLAMGMKPGPALGAVLRQVEDADLEGRLPDRAAAERFARASIAAVAAAPPPPRA